MPEKLKELNLYTMSEFEAMYRSAATAGAPVLANFLKQYKKLGVLYFELKYKYQNFAKYRRE